MPAHMGHSASILTLIRVLVVCLFLFDRCSCWESFFDYVFNQRSGQLGTQEMVLLELIPSGDRRGPLLGWGDFEVQLSGSACRSFNDQLSGSFVSPSKFTCLPPEYDDPEPDVILTLSEQQALFKGIYNKDERYVKVDVVMQNATVKVVTATSVLTPGSGMPIEVPNMPVALFFKNNKAEVGRKETSSDGVVDLLLVKGFQYEAQVNYQTFTTEGPVSHERSISVPSGGQRAVEIQTEAQVLCGASVIEMASVEETLDLAYKPAFLPPGGYCRWRVRAAHKDVSVTVRLPNDFIGEYTLQLCIDDREIYSSMTATAHDFSRRFVSVDTLEIVLSNFTIGWLPGMVIPSIHGPTVKFRVWPAMYISPSLLLITGVLLATLATIGAATCFIFILIRRRLRATINITVDLANLDRPRPGEGLPASVREAYPVFTYAFLADAVKTSAKSQSSLKGPSAPGEEEDEGAECCAICLCTYGASDQVLRLPCQHYYHQPCIDQWLQRNVHCPLCKTNLMNHKDPQPQDLLQNPEGVEVDHDHDVVATVAITLPGAIDRGICPRDDCPVEDTVVADGGQVNHHSHRLPASLSLGSTMDIDQVELREPDGTLRETDECQQLAGRVVLQVIAGSSTDESSESGTDSKSPAGEVEEGELGDEDQVLREIRVQPGGGADTS